MRSTHNDKVPEDWTRKQTLANAERYIFPELKEYEEKILGAEERIASLEGRLYSELRQSSSAMTRASCCSGRTKRERRTRSSL